MFRFGYDIVGTECVLWTSHYYTWVVIYIWYLSVWAQLRPQTLLSVQMDLAVPLMEVHLYQASFEEQPYRPAFAKNLGMCNFSANKKIFNSRSYIEDLFISNTTLNKIILMKCTGKWKLYTQIMGLLEQDIQIWTVGMHPILTPLILQISIPGCHGPPAQRTTFSTSGGSSVG